MNTSAGAVKTAGGRLLDPRKPENSRCATSQEKKGAVACTDVPLNRVMAYTHSGLVERLQDKLGITEGQAIDLFDDMKRFLYLCAVTPGPLAPSPAIDEAWHHFVLHTADYQSFCHRYFGRFIHHTPHTRAQRASIDDSAFLRMRSAGIAAFGTALSSNWDSNAGICKSCKNPEPCSNGCKDCSPTPSCSS